MPWTISFVHSDRREPVVFAGVPDSAGDKLLAFILPIVRAAEQAATTARAARTAADPYRPALDTLLELVTKTKPTKGRRR